MIRPQPRSPLFPYTPLYRSRTLFPPYGIMIWFERTEISANDTLTSRDPAFEPHPGGRSEEHTSELQSRLHLVCRLLLEKKNVRQGPRRPRPPAIPRRRRENT